MTAAAPLFFDDRARPADLPADLAGGTALVIGNFDGVHRGHRALCDRAVELAKARGLLPVALTFDPHPSVVLGRGTPDLLTTLERRVELLAGLGMAHVLVRRFDRAFSEWSPERFVKELVVGQLSAKVAVVGQNFRFGKDRAGDPALLARLGPTLGLESSTAEARDEQGPFSSTRVRDAIVAGNLALAEKILGRRHALEGPVVRGDARGRTLGFPTANVEAKVVLPPDGVYAVVVDRVTTEGAAEALAPGVMNIGVRPTVAAGGARTVEVNLFDTDLDLYGATLRVHLVARLRGEMRFAGLDALKAQIAKDAEAARAATREVRAVAPPGGTAPRFG